MKLRDLYLKINPAQGSTDGIGYTDDFFYIADSTEDCLKLQTFKGDYKEFVEKENIENEFTNLYDYLVNARRVNREGHRIRPVVYNNTVDCAFYRSNSNKKLCSIRQLTDSCMVLPFNIKPSEDSILKHFPKENIIERIRKDNVIKKESIPTQNNCEEFRVLFYDQTHMLIHKIDYKKDNSDELVIAPKKYLDFNWAFTKHQVLGLNVFEIESLLNEQFDRESKSYVKQLRKH